MRRKAAAAPVVINNQKLRSASELTQERRLMAASVFPSDGRDDGTMRGDLLIAETAVNPKQPTSFLKQTGKPKSASDFTSFLGSTALKNGNTFDRGNTQNAGKITVNGACYNTNVLIPGPYPVIADTTFDTSTGSNFSNNVFTLSNTFAVQYGTNLYSSTDYTMTISGSISQIWDGTNNGINIGVYDPGDTSYVYFTLKPGSKPNINYYTSATNHGTSLYSSIDLETTNVSVNDTFSLVFTSTNATFTYNGVQSVKMQSYISINPYKFFINLYSGTVIGTTPAKFNINYTVQRNGLSLLYPIRMAPIAEPSPYITGSTGQVKANTVARSGSDYIREKLAKQQSCGEQHNPNELGPSVFKDDTIRKPEYNKQYLSMKPNDSTILTTSIPVISTDTPDVIATTIPVITQIATPTVSSTIPVIAADTVIPAINTTVPFVSTTIPNVSTTSPTSIIPGTIPVVNTTIPKSTFTSANTVYKVTPTNLTLTLAANQSLTAGQIVNITNTGGTTPANMDGLYTVQTTLTTGTTLVLDNPRGVTTGVTGNAYLTPTYITLSGTVSGGSITVTDATGIVALAPIIITTAANGVSANIMYYVASTYVSGLTIPLATNPAGTTALTGVTTGTSSAAGRVYLTATPVTVSGTLAGASVVLLSATGITATSPIIFNNASAFNGVSGNTMYYVASTYVSGSTIPLATNPAGTTALTGVTNSLTGSSLALDSWFLATDSKVVTVNVGSTTNLAIGSIVNLASSTLPGTYSVTNVDTANLRISFIHPTINASAIVTAASTVKSYFTTDGTTVTVNVTTTSGLSVGRSVNISGIVPAGFLGTFPITAIDSVNNTISFPNTTVATNITSAGILSSAIPVVSTTIPRINPLLITVGKTFTNTSGTVVCNIDSTTGLSAGTIVEILNTNIFDGIYTLTAVTNTSISFINKNVNSTGSITSQGIVSSGFFGDGTSVTLNVASVNDLAVGSIVNVEAITPTTLQGVCTLQSVDTINKTITFANTSLGGSVDVSGTVKSSFKTNGTSVTVNVSTTLGLSVGSPINIVGIAPSGLTGTYLIRSIDSANNTISYANTTAVGNITVATVATAGTLSELAFLGSGANLTVNSSSAVTSGTYVIGTPYTPNATFGDFKLGTVYYVYETVTSSTTPRFTITPGGGGTAIPLSPTGQLNGCVILNLASTYNLAKGSYINISNTGVGGINVTTQLLTVDPVANTVTFANVTATNTITSATVLSSTTGTTSLTMKLASVSGLGKGSIVQIATITSSSGTLTGVYELSSVDTDNNTITYTPSSAPSGSGATITASGTLKSAFIGAGSGGSATVKINVATAPAYAAGKKVRISGVGGITAGNYPLTATSVTDTNSITFTYGSILASTNITSSGTVVTAFTTDTTNVSVYYDSTSALTVGTIVNITGTGNSLIDGVRSLLTGTDATTMVFAGTVAGTFTSPGTVKNGFVSDGTSVTVNTSSALTTGTIVNITGVSGFPSGLVGNWLVTDVGALANKTITFVNPTPSGSILGAGTIVNGFLSNNGIVTLNVASTTGLAAGKIVKIGAIVSTGDLTTLRGIYQLLTCDTSKTTGTISFYNSTAAAAITTVGTVDSAFLGTSYAQGSITLNTAVAVPTGSIVSVTGFTGDDPPNGFYTVSSSSTIGSVYTITYQVSKPTVSAITSGTLNVKTAFIGTGNGSGSGIVTLNVVSTTGLRVGDIVNVEAIVQTTGSATTLWTLTPITAIDYVNNTVSYSNNTASDTIKTKGTVKSAFTGGTTVTMNVASTKNMVPGTPIVISSTGNLDGPYTIRSIPDSTHITFTKTITSANVTTAGVLSNTVPSASMCPPNAMFPSVNHTHPAIQPRQAWSARPTKSGIPVFNVPSKENPKPVAGSLPNCFTGENTTGVFSRGGILPKDMTRYVERKHGNDLLAVNPRKPIFRRYQIPAGTPSHMKINEPNLVKTPNM